MIKHKQKNTVILH